MNITIFIVAVVIGILIRTYRRYHARDITGREFVLWTFFWLTVVIAALVPKQTDVIANWVGVERGADLLVYLSIIALFFIVFKIVVKLEQVQRDITQIVRTQALHDAAAVSHESQRTESTKQAN